jgi:hypothetical protein
MQQMKKYILSFISIFFFCLSYSQDKMTSINKNRMTVSWEFKNDRIYFEMIAPTYGWVAIGFNDSENTAGNYLIMGNVVNNKVTVEEHYTISPGNYQTFAKLNTSASLKNTNGEESLSKTTIRFSLPTTSSNKYAKDLKQNTEFILLIAYSQEDDFQHHSIMRTATKITL